MTTYTLPERNDTYEDWAGCQARGYVPTERQRPIVDAVAAALAAGLYYSRDVLADVIRRMGIPPEVAEVQQSQTCRNEGGVVGMDAYYARRYLEARAAHRAEDEARAILAPEPGKALGTLIFSDCKQTRACTIIAAPPGDDIRVQGTRGRYSVLVTCTARQIVAAQERARERAGSR